MFIVMLVKSSLGTNGIGIKWLLFDLWSWAEVSFGGGAPGASVT